MSILSWVICSFVVIVCIFLYWAYRNKKIREWIENQGDFLNFSNAIISLLVAVLFGISANILAEVSNELSKRSMPIHIRTKLEMTQSEGRISNISNEYTYNFKVNREVVEGELFLEYFIHYPINENKVKPTDFKIEATTEATINKESITGTFDLNFSPIPFSFFMLTIDRNRNRELKYYHYITKPTISGNVLNSTGNIEVNSSPEIYFNEWNASDLFDEALIEKVNEVISGELSNFEIRNESFYLLNKEMLEKKYIEIKKFSDSLIY